MTMGSRKTVPPLDFCRGVSCEVFFFSSSFFFLREGYSNVQDVSDGAVGGQPHLLELELLDTGLIGGDGGALDADAVLLDSFSGVDGDLVICLVTVGETLQREKKRKWRLVAVMQCNAHHHICVCMSIGY